MLQIQIGIPRVAIIGSIYLGCLSRQILPQLDSQKMLTLPFGSVSHVPLFVRHEPQPTRLHCPWNSPCKNTAVGSHSLLQGISLTQGLNPGLPHCRQILYRLSLQVKSHGNSTALRVLDSTLFRVLSYIVTYYPILHSNIVMSYMGLPRWRQ